MFDINLYFVDSKNNTSRFYVELINNKQDIPSYFYYEITAEFPTGSGNKDLKITSVKEIYDIISFLYNHYGDNDSSRYIITGDNKEKILSSIDKLENEYESGNINPDTDLERFLKIYNEPDKKTNDNIYKENNKFIREYLSSKQKGKDIKLNDK